MNIKQQWLKAVSLAFATALISSMVFAEKLQTMPTNQYSVVPTDGKITIIDYGYREWPAELLHYTIDTKVFKPGKVILRDEKGVEVPCQIDGNVLSFVAALGKGKKAEFTLSAGKPDTKLPTLTVKKAGDWLEIGNSLFTVRVPAEKKKSFKKPVAVTTVPAPLLGWQNAGGPWIGGSRFITDRMVTGYAMSIIQQGATNIIYEARYQFAPKGEYVCRIQVIPGLDRAEVTEEFDFNEITKGQDFLLLDFNAGYTPATLGWVAGEDGHIERSDYISTIAARLKDGTNPPAPVGGAGVTPMPPVPETGMVLLNKILAAGKWGGNKGGVEIRGAADKNVVPAVRCAVVPLHTGAWRRAMALTVWGKPDAGVLVALPISVRPVTWYTEVTDDISPFSSHEHDTGIKDSYGRREWALYFGDKTEDVQRTVGYIGLDNYKEWVLDWTETAKAADYPRAWVTREGVERLKKSLAQHPDKALLSTYYIFSGKTEDAVRNGNNFINGMLGQFNYLGDWTVYGLSHYRQSESLTNTLAAEDALSCHDLPNELRQKIRRVLAVGAYLMSNPDLNPRGVGVHLGNNNMSINRTCALAFFAGLLPDHPMDKYWMEQITAFVGCKVGTYITPDGAALEPPTYQLYGPMRFLDDAVTIIHNTGGPDFASYIAANVRYLANLSMPDPRIDGRRMLPGMGNSGNMLESIFGITLATTERSDKELAGQMAMLHQRVWPTEPVAGLLANHPEKAFRYLPDIPEKNIPLTTTIMPAYGVVFRAHFGSPNETGMLFRAGVNWGHWDTDAGNVVLYGKGAPLSPGTGYQYYGGPGSDNNAIYHNQVKVGQHDLTEVFGRVDDAIQDYGFGPNVDYAVSSRYYPQDIFTDGKGEMSWNRHVLFLKSDKPEGANYFVMRDTFPGGKDRPTWWTWLNLDGADKISVEGKAFDPATTPYNKQVPEAQMPVMTGNNLEMKTTYGAGTHFWFAGEPLPIRLRLTWDYPQQTRLGMKAEQFLKLTQKEVKTTVEAIAKPGKDYYYVVYPHKDAEAVPPCVDLGNGGIKVTTPEATDYIFISDTPLNFNADGITFTGKAGVLRIFHDRVVFCMNSGSGSVGYKGHIFTGNGPFEKTVKLSDLKAGNYPVNITDEKKIQTVDIGGGITIRGEGQFKGTQDGKAIRITTDGRARVLYVTRPNWIWQPYYLVDGVSWMANWTDYPSSGWGAYKYTNLMAISVPAGKHELVLTNLVYPSVWTRQFVPGISGIVK
jgi:hypothetical protein